MDILTRFAGLRRSVGGAQTFIEIWMTLLHALTPRNANTVMKTISLSIKIAQSLNFRNKF